MINRRRTLAALLALWAIPLRGGSQPAAGMPRVGLLSVYSGGLTVIVEQLRNELRALGYIEGRNIHIDDRFLVRDYDQLARAAEQLLGQNPSVIVALGDTASVIASKATATVPIVGSFSSDPVRRGLAVSLARPGKNVTGVLSATGDLTGKRLGMVKEVTPGLRRVVVLLNPGSAGEVAVVRDLEVTARRLDLELRPIEVRSEGDFEAVLPAIAQTRAGALVAVSSSMFVANRESLVKAIAKTRLPAIYASATIVEAGGLMSYGSNSNEVAQIRARQVDQILKGARPGDIPFEQITKVELVVNLSTARNLGIAIPQTLLLRADRVID